VGRKAPRTPEASLEIRQLEQVDIDRLISCIYDDIAPNIERHFGNNIIQLPQELGGWCFSETGERLLYVVFHPEAGRATVQNAQRRHLGNVDLIPQQNHALTAYPPSVSQSRDLRSARTVIDFAVANHLVRHFILTYEEQPDTTVTAAREFEKFIRRTRRKCGQFAWVQVLERGELNDRLHHHLMAGGGLRPGDVETLWGNGFVLHKQLRKVTGIRTTAGYLCKTFRTPECDRLGSHRYRVSRHGVRPRARGMVVTEAEYRAIIEQLAPAGSYDWYPDDPVAFHEYSTLWDPYINVYKNQPKIA